MQALFYIENCCIAEGCFVAISGIGDWTDCICEENILLHVIEAIADRERWYDQPVDFPLDLEINATSI